MRRLIAIEYPDELVREPEQLTTWKLLSGAKYYRNDSDYGDRVSVGFIDLSPETLERAADEFDHRSRVCMAARPCMREHSKRYAKDRDQLRIAAAALRGSEERDV